MYNEKWGIIRLTIKGDNENGRRSIITTDKQASETQLVCRFCNFYERIEK